MDESGDVIVYDQSSVSTASVSPDSFLHVLLHKLVHVFRRVFLLSGGFLEFQACYGDLCEDKSRLLRSTTLNMTSLSQPCLPITNVGPTRILPFLYLGSQQDAHNQELLSVRYQTTCLTSPLICPLITMFSSRRITTSHTKSTSAPTAQNPISSKTATFSGCPSMTRTERSFCLTLSAPRNLSVRFMNPSRFNSLLLPLRYPLNDAVFIDKVRETNGSVLVHCLAGISRSPTVAIAYVMRHLQMTFDDAFRYVKSKRSSISPNFNFLGQLLEYERQLRAEEVKLTKKVFSF